VPRQQEVLRDVQAAVLALSLPERPSLSLPCGLDPQGLPVGLQIVGRPFEEARLRRIQAACESRL
jgi:aspartyl-tRNA(Asn)/glutamyl-tRNA(Gln) amidotransferase subunit A